MVKSAMALILRRRGRRRRRAARPAQQVAEAAVDARGQEDDEDDEEQPVDRLGHAHVRDAEHHAQHLGQRDRERGADGGAEERVHPAEHDREHDAQRHADAGQRVGVHIGDVLRVRDADGEGDEAEVVTDDREARARVSDHDGEDGGEGHGDEGAEPRRQPEEVPEQGRRVGAEPKEGAVTEGDEAEAAHQRPRPADERPDEDLDQHVQHVLAHAVHRHERHRHHDREQHAPDQTTRAHARLPRMPPGRAKIMTMKNTKAITYPISVDHITPPIEMTSLMMNDATNAPTMFPSPPSTQIMNVSGPKAAPKNGCTEYWMISSAAATPASAPPTAEVTI